MRCSSIKLQKDTDETREVHTGGRGQPEMTPFCIHSGQASFRVKMFQGPVSGTLPGRAQGF